MLFSCSSKVTGLSVLQIIFTMNIQWILMPVFLMPFWPCRSLLENDSRKWFFTERKMGTHSPLPPTAGCSMAFSSPATWNSMCPTWNSQTTTPVPASPHTPDQELNWPLGWEACHIQEHCRIMDIFPEHKVLTWHANFLGLPHCFISAFPPKPSQS